MDRSDDQVAAWRAVLIAHSRVVWAIERDLDEAGAISLGWYDVLLELNAAPGRQLRMQDLAARAVLSRTRISRIVSELQAAGMVERNQDPSDGRVTLATLTRAGRATLKQTAPLYLAGIDRHFNRHVAPADRTVLTRALTRVIDAHQAGLDPRR